jgi:hypothetical protein
LAQCFHVPPPFYLLACPLGPWLEPPTCRWEWFYDSSEEQLYRFKPDGWDFFLVYQDVPVIVVHHLDFAMLALKPWNFCQPRVSFALLLKLVMAFCTILGVVHWFGKKMQRPCINGHGLSPSRCTVVS